MPAPGMLAQGSRFGIATHAGKPAMRTSPIRLTTAKLVPIGMVKSFAFGMNFHRLVCLVEALVALPLLGPVDMMFHCSARVHLALADGA